MAYDDENPYEGYDKGGITPQELLARLMSLQRRIAATISLVERDGTDIRERQAQFVIELDEIKASVLDITKDINGLDAKYAEFKVTAEEILASVSRHVEQLDGTIANLRAEISVMAGAITLKAEATVVTSLGTRVSSAEQNINALDGSISSKVSFTDYNGQQIVSRINQTAASFSIDANKINLSGLTEVADTLYIGGNFRDSGEKAIQFRGSFGGVYIGSPTQDTLHLSALSGITMDSWVYFTRSVDFSGATVTGLTVPYANNAGTVGGLSSNAFPHLPPHQYGASVSFAGNGDMTWIVNGNAFTYRRI